MRSRVDALLLIGISLAAGVFLGARAPGDFVRASLLSRFRLEQVATRGTRELLPKEVAEATRLLPGTPFHEVDPTRIEAQLQRHPWIRRARVTRLPPSRVLVDVVERRPTAVAELGEASHRWLVDEEGAAFAKASPAHAERLPVLRLGSGSPEPDRAALHEGLRIVRLVEGRGLPAVETVWLERGAAGPGVALRLRDEPPLIVLGAEPFAPKLDRLERLRAASLSESAAAATIDLRFAGRVVLRRDPAPDRGGAAGARNRVPPPERSRPG